MFTCLILTGDLNELLQVKDEPCPIARQVCMKPVFCEETLIILILPLRSFAWQLC